MLRQTKLEVGEVQTAHALLSPLVLVMEGWVDWLLVVPQVKARVFVFCNLLPGEVYLPAEKTSSPELDVLVEELLPIESLWSHGVLSESDTCVLALGVPEFVEMCLARLPAEVWVVGAVSHGRRGQQTQCWND